MEDPDWDKGLPTDVIALIARSVYMGETAVMREVCKTWQQGFELGVSSIRHSHSTAE